MYNIEIPNNIYYKENVFCNIKLEHRQFNVTLSNKDWFMMRQRLNTQQGERSQPARLKFIFDFHLKNLPYIVYVSATHLELIHLVTNPHFGDSHKVELLYI